MPKLDSGGRAPLLAPFSRRTLCSAALQPPPPHSFFPSRPVPGLSRAPPLVLGPAKAAAAIFLRPIRYGPALVAHALEPDALRLGREFCVASAPEHVGIRSCGLAHFRRAIGFEPGARFTAECFEIGGLSLAGPGVSHWSFPSI